jgi:hypothetical protein
MEAWVFDCMEQASGIKINVPSYTDRVLWKSFPGARIKQVRTGLAFF